MGAMHPDDIRTLFSRAMSELYRKEVPQYGALCELVAKVNEETLAVNPQQAAALRRDGQLDRLEVERHGAIRLGTAKELATVRRLFALIGMYSVGYYDLSLAGVPVHATAFRPVSDAALERNPFRVFTSLLRLDLIRDPDLRSQAALILAERNIFTERCLALLELGEANGGLSAADAREFVTELLHTFRWHRDATVDLETYRKLRATHALVADIVCFKGPHVNHLTPRTLDIDAVQKRMPSVGLIAKDSIEGPPRRRFPILLRQTSFLALEEQIRFIGDGDQSTHTARFGEVEQRGCALTRKGRELYDQLLQQSRGSKDPHALQKAFESFPDDALTLYREGLAFVRFRVGARGATLGDSPESIGVEGLIAGGWLILEPMTYEDFLPVSAAGIFRSNLGDEARESYVGKGNRSEFETALGGAMLDELALYEQAQAQSLAACFRTLATSQPAWSAK